MSTVPKKDPALVRACRYYVLALFAFGLLVPFFPRSIQRATHPGAVPIGTAMMITLAFSLPIAAPRSESESLRSRISFAILFICVMSAIMAVARYQVAHPAPPVPTSPAPSARCT